MFQSRNYWLDGFVVDIDNGSSRCGWTQNQIRATYIDPTFSTPWHIRFQILKIHASVIF